ncbi:GIY-YIG nuclease family protein [Sulfuricaulis sp.]|jgi:Uri superfamily endonuclease|uniref:GIY-YIG nuclease family protein n=1 Tax=Sulfuricaulis sp. TaxID=2003553 RepID=UPI00355A09C5
MAKKRRKTKTTKGALIKGMSRKLPSEILASPIFREKLKELMKGYAGIYALYRKGSVYYVGLTTNLFGRVSHHLKDRHKSKWDHFVIARIKRVNYLKDIETLLTHLMDLPGNRVKGHVPKDADINGILRQILAVHSREIREIKKVLKK